MKSRPSWLGITITGALAVLSLVLALIGFSMVPAEIVPERADPTPVATTATQVGPTPTPAPHESSSTKPAVPTIKASDIVRLQIPALKIDAGASGPTMPRKSERCHGGSECLDPPELKKVAWYGAYARPALPRHDTVIILGHSNHYNNVWQTFNNLPAAEKGDKVIVTTKTGVFTYKVTKKALVPYEDVPESELIFGNTPNRVVLVTCNSREQAGTVVVATLVGAKRR